MKSLNESRIQICMMMHVQAIKQVMLISLVVTSLILEMDLMEMFDTLDEHPTGAAGQWKWNEPRGVFSQSLKNKLCDCNLFVCLFVCLLVSLAYTN